MPRKAPKIAKPAEEPKVAATPAPTGQVQERRDFSTRFKPGVSGNPSGRKKGTRNHLSEAFVAALNEDFAENGIEVIRAVREERPADYLKIIASIVPKDLNLNTRPVLEEMSDEELLESLAEIKEILGMVSAGDTWSRAPSSRKAH